MGRRIRKEIKQEILAKVEAGERVVSVLQYNKLKREDEELKRLISELTLNMHLQKKPK